MITQSRLLVQTPLGGSFSGLSDRFNPVDDGTVALNELFSIIFSFLTVIGGLAFLIYFTVGALNWITAGGDQKKVDDAKKYMTNGAVGMIIIVAAYSIISIIGTVLGLDILNPGSVIKTIINGSSTGGT